MTHTGGTTTSKKDAETKQKILDMHLACYTQQVIADAVGVAQPTVVAKIAEFIENESYNDSDIFRNFEERKIYTVWNFPKSTNEVKHFGNIPPDLPQRPYRSNL